MVSVTSCLHGSYFIAPLYNLHHFFSGTSVGGLGDHFLVTWLYYVFIRENWEDHQQESMAMDKIDNET